MDIITTHLHADFDGLASMVAARKLYPGAVLVFPGGAQETVRRFLAVYDLGLTRLKDLELQQVTRLILVDTQEPERLGPLQSLCMNPAVAIHIFDHHPETAGEACPLACQAELKVVEPVGATTTVLIKRILQRGLALSPLEATVLAHGRRDMPVWGERFGEIVGHDLLGEAVIRSHLQLFIAYLQAIQQ